MFGPRRGRTEGFQRAHAEAPGTGRLRDDPFEKRRIGRGPNVQNDVVPRGGRGDEHPLRNRLLAVLRDARLHPARGGSDENLGMRDCRARLGETQVDMVEQRSGDGRG